MPSTSQLASRAVAAAFVVAGVWAPEGRAQAPAEGFAVERFYAAPAGAGWFAMDDLNLRGGLGGAAALSFGYARRPLKVESADGRQRLDVVSDQAFVELALAVTYDRLRLSANLSGPLFLSGASGQVDGLQFTAPTASLAQNPDTIADPRLGIDARILGEPSGPFRLGAGAQVIIPSGARSDYLTDDRYRAMGRLLVAGDLDRFGYAGHLGVHLRSLDGGPAPGSPRGSELLFGLAGGARFPIASGAIVVGPEIYGETALRSFLGARTTGLEALLGARLEGTRSDSAGYRLKLGVGGGLVPRFGAPDLRVVIAFELFSRP